MEWNKLRWREQMIEDSENSLKGDGRGEEEVVIEGNKKGWLIIWTPCKCLTGIIDLKKTRITDNCGWKEKMGNLRGDSEAMWAEAAGD